MSFRFLPFKTLLLAGRTEIRVPSQSATKDNPVSKTSPLARARVVATRDPFLQKYRPASFLNSLLVKRVSTDKLGLIRGPVSSPPL